MKTLILTLSSITALALASCAPLNSASVCAKCGKGGCTKCASAACAKCGKEGCTKCAPAACPKCGKAGCTTCK